MRNDAKLAAFCVQRRSIAAAIFVGTHLGFSDARQLTSDRQKAGTTAVGFVNWILESFDIDVTVLESFEGDPGLMRAGIYQAVDRTLRESGASIQTIRAPEFLCAFTHPSRTTREDVRQVVMTIWPILEARRAHPATLDAVALGLYHQTDRLLQ